MNSFRISKYDPSFIKDGKFIKDEWTDYSDIGEKFEGGTFTEQEYLLVEQNYILCITNILKNASIEKLSIENYENYHTDAWKNTQYVTIDMLAQLIRDCLRNKCWCKLISDKGYVHFGYDFYFYVGCELSFGDILTICEKYNLFCDVHESPYITD